MGFFGRKDDQSIEAVMSSVKREIDRGNWPKADEILQTALKSRSSSDSQDAVTARLLSLGAVTAVRMNELLRGIDLARQAVAVWEKLDDESDGLMSDLNNLGTFLRLNNQHGEATPYMERSVALRRNRFGDDDQMTVRMMVYLAQNFIETDDFDHAYAIMDTLFETCHRAGHVEVQVEAIEVLGDSLQKKQKHQEVQQLCQSEMEFLANQVGPQSPALSVPALVMGRNFLASGDVNGAGEWLTIAYNMRRKLIGPDHVLTARAGQNLGILYMALEEFDTAVTFYEEALNIARKNQDTDLVLRVISNYSSCLNQMGRTEEASKLAAEAQRLQGG